MVFVGCLKKRLSNGTAGWDVDICYITIYIYNYTVYTCLCMIRWELVFTIISQLCACDPVGSRHGNELYKRVESLIRMKKGAEARCENSSNFQFWYLSPSHIILTTSYVHCTIQYYPYLFHSFSCWKSAWFSKPRGSPGAVRLPDSRWKMEEEVWQMQVASWMILCV